MFKVIERHAEKGWRVEVKIKCTKCGYEYWEFEDAIPSVCNSDECRAKRRKSLDELFKTLLK